MDRIALSPRSAAAALDLSVSTLYRLIRAGDIPVVRIRGSVRIPTAALQAFVDASAARANNQMSCPTAATTRHIGGSPGPTQTAAAVLDLAKRLTTDKPKR
jgi:excisionase family DNA binding protein